MLGDVAEVTKLAGFEFTEHIRYSEMGKIIAIRALNVKHGKLDLSQVKYVDDSNFAKLARSKLYRNDMIFTYVGTIGQVALVDENDRYYLAPNVARIRFNSAGILPLFMRYYFQTNHFYNAQIIRLLESSSMENLTMSSIRKFQIAVPPLPIQHAIVAILDRFDALTSDLTQGLPAEIAARQQQYAYYRDRLLTFREKSA
jgi:type I restriction enzyme, S subunit